jgi:tRNA(Ile)-lysidine synthase
VAAIKSEPQGLAAGIAEVLDRRLSLTSKAPIAVAYSGGGDSLALLLTACAWAARVRRRLLVLTVDHGLQPQSRSWSRLAEANAMRLGADFQALEWAGKKPSTGLPAAARRARHALIAAAARDAGAKVVLFGHTLDDVLESALMRDEGSSIGSPREWSASPAWPEGCDVFLLRPMLNQRRADLRRWIAGQGFDWIEDPANEDGRFARARARRALSPSLPVRQGVTDQSSRASDVDLGELSKLCDIDRFGVIRIPRGALGRADKDAARRLLAIACVCAGGADRRPRRGRAERLLERILSGEAFVACLAGASVRAGEHIEISRDAGEAARGGLAALALESGVPVVWDGRFEILVQGLGARVAPLRGKASRLDASEQRALKSAPAAARGALPSVIIQDGLVTCPILAPGAKERVRCLVGPRFIAACGMVASEDRIGCAPDSEPAYKALS